MRILLNDVRLSFPNIFTPKSFDGGEAKYSASFLFEPDSAAHRELETAIQKLINDKWQEEKDRKRVKTCLHDGNEKDYDGYENMMFLSASSKRRPQVVDRKRQPVLDEDDIIYPGCYVNAVVDLWTMDNKFGKRVCAELKAVQFARDGESFVAGGVDVDSVFNDLDSIEEADIPFDDF
ncbi:MAG: DUF2815 family protein [Chloroflexi bacterium]|nr:MAG: DUF2815 family protein [Chloroflexota bacterium]